MSFIEQYLLQLNTEKRRWRRAVVILSALSLIVALVTVWNLRMTGVTIANSASCGYEEHLHTDECNKNACGIAEHIHSISCYSNPSADVETSEMWEASLPNDLGKYWSENLARIAVSQIGFTESERNYIVADDGETKQGITRYGQWYGNPHGDWSAMFVAFCLHYADVPQDAIPWSPGVYNMMQLCADKEILSQPDEYVGMKGNILFLDTDGNENADKMLIVTALEEPSAEDGTITAVGGDWDNSVAEVKIANDDPHIVGYIHTAAVREAYLQSLPLYSIDKNSNIYTIDIYALPVDYDGNRITDLPVTELGTLRVNNTTKRTVANQFDYDLGVYHNAYFGTETSVSVDNINSVWRYQRWGTYYLAYNQTNGTQNQQWLNTADTTISLYLRYTPEFTVTFQSEGFDSVLEYVVYKDYPTETSPSQWSRDGYTLVGWLASDNQTVYSFDEVMARPVTSSVTYTAQWRQFVTVKFDTGQYSDLLHPIDDIQIAYGTHPTLLPTPGWKNNSVVMAFDGWYLNSNLTQPVTPETVFYEDTTLYAKWNPKEDGYYVYFMDFAREGQTPLVLMTYSVTENQTASSYTMPTT